MDKKTIRLLVQDLIHNLPEETKKQESDIVCQKLRDILSQKNFNTLVTYTAFHDELDVSWISDWCDTGWKNILTIPQSNENITIPPDALILAPGRAFTKDGKRIGRGSGYYDKLLSQHPHLQTIGVCFNCQIFEDLPQDEWDKQMDEVVFA